MICPRCNIEMKIGYAIWPWYPWYSRFVLYFATQPKGEKLKEVYKCPKCGHSDEIKND